MLLELCAIRVDGASADWSLLAREAQDDGGLDRLWQAVIRERSAAARRSLPVLLAGLREPGALAERVDAELAAADRAGARLVTVLDGGYPPNLRQIPNLPPFLFYRGDLLDTDTQSVAVVGTRQPTQAGLGRAALMARELAGEGLTVVSGLAAGIDTAAHRAALTAGARTIAVLGTGITRCYPSANSGLAEEISGSGALVSQFWPTQSPGRETFPRRNVVTSGISRGTVVIEAGSTSGARMQARIATEQGKRVFLLRSLVAGEQWAAGYVEQRGAIEVERAGDVVAQLAGPGPRPGPEPPRGRRAGERHQQLTLSFT